MKTFRTGRSVSQWSVKKASSVPMNFLTDHTANYMKYGVTTYIMTSHILSTHPKREDSSQATCPGGEMPAEAKPTDLHAMFLFRIWASFYKYGKNTRRLLNEVSGRLYLRHSQFCDVADGKWIQQSSKTPLSLILITSKHESRYRLTVGRSVCLSCSANDQTFIWSVLFCAADAQIFVWSVSCGWWPDFVRSVLFCAADDQIFAWSVSCGWWPDFVRSVLFCGADDQISSGQSCFVRLMPRFLPGLSRAADDQTFAWSVSCGLWPDFVRSVLFCGADAQIFVRPVSCGRWPDFCPVCLVRLMTRFLPMIRIMPSYCLVAHSLLNAVGLPVVVSHRLCHKHVSTYFQIRWCSVRTFRHLMYNIHTASLSRNYLT